MWTFLRDFFWLNYRGVAQELWQEMKNVLKGMLNNLRILYLIQFVNRKNYFTHMSFSQLVKILTSENSVEQGQSQRGHEMHSSLGLTALGTSRGCKHFSSAETAWHKTADPEATESDQIHSVQRCAWKMGEKREKINNLGIINSVQVTL